ncbi:WG repeat-containing protein [Kosakonia sp.]|uniref:WG repeat-containing protein n=1 Tax=Kosakonia sp. TaxID=1916651 RepID=UPI002898CE6B|nr:WG repeat-containing protein [Kosakonia sp.]
MMCRIITGMLLMAAFSTQAALKPVYGCSYWNKKTDTLEKLDKCAAVKEGKLVFLPDLFAKSHDVDGMSWVGLYDYTRDAQLPDADYYVRSADNYLSVVHFDNGPDWFVEGLVRSRQNGKVGYWDDTFRNRIAPQFDYAWQFNAGKALVCNGCAPQKDGEHVALMGGQWFYIDKNGQRVSEIKSGPF